MANKEIKLFNLLATEGGFKPNLGTALKTLLLSGAALGIGLGAKYAVDWVDDVMHPQYFVSQSFTSPIPDDVPQWQPRTDWSRR